MSLDAERFAALLTTLPADAAQELRAGWDALTAENAALREQLEQAPTPEQLQSLVAQLKEVRGENAALREQLRTRA